MSFQPGIPTAVPGRASMVVDLRNGQVAGLFEFVDPLFPLWVHDLRERGD